MTTALVEERVCPRGSYGPKQAYPSQHFQPPLSSLSYWPNLDPTDSQNSSENQEVPASPSPDTNNEVSVGPRGSYGHKQGNPIAKFYPNLSPTSEQPPSNTIETPSSQDNRHSLTRTMMAANNNACTSPRSSNILNQANPLQKYILFLQPLQNGPLPT